MYWWLPIDTVFIHFIYQFHQSCGINARECLHGPAAPRQGILGALIFWWPVSFWLQWTVIILITMGTVYDGSPAKFPTKPTEEYKNWKIYAIKQIKICSEYRVMLPRPRLDLSGTPRITIAIHIRIDHRLAERKAFLMSLLYYITIPMPNSSCCFRYVSECNYQTRRLKDFNYLCLSKTVYQGLYLQNPRSCWHLCLAHVCMVSYALIMWPQSKMIQPKGIYPSVRPLTYWGRDKITAILQTTFSNVFSWMKTF